MEKTILDDGNFGSPKPLEFGTAIKLLLFIWWLVAMFGCAEKEPPATLEEQLQGGWVRTGGFIENRYRFSVGALDVYSVFSNQVVFENNYAYATEGNTLLLVDLVEGTRSDFVVEFPTDSTAVLSPQFGLQIFLKRFQP